MARTLCLVTVLLLAPLASATHAQVENGQVIVFDHKTGNEWWVEVVLSGESSGSVTRVEAMDTDGPWFGLSKNQWGAWGGSFRIEPGHQVRFVAFWDGGSEATSCWFTHPEGAEVCGDPPPTGPATFDHKGGNEWWVEVQVTGAVPSRVQAMDDGGPWVELTLRSWGHWAKSFHIEPGHQVLFQAWVDGAWRPSCWFTHPEGKTPSGSETCPRQTTEPPEPFEASFAHVKGNEWWVETKVTANEPVSRVQARSAMLNAETSGPWRDLELRSWGAWAASFYVPYNSIVQLRAYSVDGDEDYSPNGWEWPHAVPYPVTGAGNAYPAKFHHVTGGDHWVQVNVYVPEGHLGIASVEVQIEGGAWQPLARQPWGDWAASIPIPAGSQVLFAALSERDNVREESDVYVWPHGGSAPPWPVEGSHVEYSLGSRIVQGNMWEETHATMTLRREGTLWRATCDGHTASYDGSNVTTKDWTYETVQGPRQTNPDRPPGTTFNTRVVVTDAHWETCELTEWVVESQGDQWRTTRMRDDDGDAFVLRALVADEQDDDGILDLEIAWEKRYGLALDWSRSGRMSQMVHYWGSLSDTDAPIL